MRGMHVRKALVQLLSFFALTCIAMPAQTFKEVGHLYRATDKAKPKHVDGSIFIDSAEKALTFTSTRRVHKEPWLRFSIKDTALTSVMYERTAKPRYAAGLLLAWPLLFTKEKKHFLTLQYKADSGDGKYAIFQLDKGNYRECLSAIEATLGKKVERNEER
jgi:hypothetical protein